MTAVGVKKGQVGLDMGHVAKLDLPPEVGVPEVVETLN